MASNAADGEIEISSISSFEKEEVKAARVLLSVAFKSTTIRHFLSKRVQIARIPQQAPNASISIFV